MIAIASAVIVLVAAGVAAGSILFYYFKTSVPPVPTSKSEIDDVIALLRGADLPPRPILYELGGGWGGLALALGGAFPDATVHAIEISPLPWLVAWLRARRTGNVVVERGDYLRRSVADADAVTAYLMIGPLPRLAAKLDAELRPGTPVVAVAFWFRDRTAAATCHADVALYRWPGNRV